MGVATSGEAPRKVFWVLYTKHWHQILWGSPREVGECLADNSRVTDRFFSSQLPSPLGGAKKRLDVGPNESQVDPNEF